MSFFNISNNEIISELKKAEEEINGMINNFSSVKNGYKEYGLIDSKQLEEYINYLKNSKFNQIVRISFAKEDIFLQKGYKKLFIYRWSNDV